MKNLILILMVWSLSDCFSQETQYVFEHTQRTQNVPLEKLAGRIDDIYRLKPDKRFIQSINFLKNQVGINSDVDLSYTYDAEKSLWNLGSTKPLETLGTLGSLPQYPDLPDFLSLLNPIIDSHYSALLPELKDVVMEELSWDFVSNLEHYIEELKQPLTTGKQIAKRAQFCAMIAINFPRGLFAFDEFESQCLGQLALVLRSGNPHFNILASIFFFRIGYSAFAKSLVENNPEFAWMKLFLENKQSYEDWILKQNEVNIFQIYIHFHNMRKLKQNEKYRQFELDKYFKKYGENVTHAFSRFYNLEQGSGTPYDPYFYSERLINHYKVNSLASGLLKILNNKFLSPYLQSSFLSVVMQPLLRYANLASLNDVDKYFKKFKWEIGFEQTLSLTVEKLILNLKNIGCDFAQNYRADENQQKKCSEYYSHSQHEFHQSLSQYYEYSLTGTPNEKKQKILSNNHFNLDFIYNSIVQKMSNDLRGNHEAPVLLAIYAANLDSRMLYRYLWALSTNGILRDVYRYNEAMNTLFIQGGDDYSSDKNQEHANLVYNDLSLEQILENAIFDSAYKIRYFLSDKGKSRWGEESLKTALSYYSREENRFRYNLFQLFLNYYYQEKEYDNNISFINNYKIYFDSDKDLNYGFANNELAYNYFYKNEYENALKFNNEAYRVYFTSSILLRSKILRKLGRGEEALAVAQQGLKRYNDKRIFQEVFASLLFLNRFQDAVAVISEFKMEKDFSHFLNKIFFDEMKEKSNKELEKAFTAFFINEYFKIQAMYMVSTFTDEKSYEKAYFLFSLFKDSDFSFSQQNMTRYIYFFYQFKNLNSWKGQEEATNWIQTKIPKENLGQLNMILATQHLWDLIPKFSKDFGISKDDQFSALINLLALTYIKSEDERVELIAKMKNYYSVNQSNDFYFTMGKHILGMNDVQDVIKSIGSEPKKSEFCFFMGVKYELEKKYVEAMNWYIANQYEGHYQNIDFTLSLEKRNFLPLDSLVK